jgi:hypothetical protein
VMLNSDTSKYLSCWRNDDSQQNVFSNTLIFFEVSHISSCQRLFRLVLLLFYAFWPTEHHSLRKTFRCKTENHEMQAVTIRFDSRRVQGDASPIKSAISCILSLLKTSKELCQTGFSVYHSRTCECFILKIDFLILHAFKLYS